MINWNQYVIIIVSLYVCKRKPVELSSVTTYTSGIIRYNISISALNFINWQSLLIYYIILSWNLQIPYYEIKYKNC